MVHVCSELLCCGYSCLRLVILDMNVCVIRVMVDDLRTVGFSSQVLCLIMNW